MQRVVKFGPALAKADDKHLGNPQLLPPQVLSRCKGKGLNYET